MAELKVGDKLWFVPNYRRGKGYEVVVQKVGRKLADIGERRSKLDMETMIVKDAGNSYGACYRSEDEYLSECMRESQQNALIQKISRSYCIQWTMDQITKAAEILGIKLPEPTK